MIVFCVRIGVDKWWQQSLVQGHGQKGIHCQGQNFDSWPLGFGGQCHRGHHLWSKLQQKNVELFVQILTLLARPASRMGTSKWMFPTQCMETAPIQCKPEVVASRASWSMSHRIISLIWRDLRQNSMDIRVCSVMFFQNWPFFNPADPQGIT